MQNLVINTTQNVAINYEPAGLGNRILSALLDWLFRMGYLFCIGILASLFATFRVGISFTDVFYVLLWVIIIIPFLFYDLLFEIFMRGQSPGKKLLKIRVVKLDGTQATVSAYLLRWLIGLFEFGMSSGLIAVVCVAASKKSQRLGDMAAGTTVVRIKQAVSLQDTILQQEQKESYKTTFPEVALLSDAEAQLIKDTLDFYKETQHTEALQKLSKKIKAKIHVTSSLSDEDFLKTLLRDFNNQSEK